MQNVQIQFIAGGFLCITPRIASCSGSDSLWDRSTTNFWLRYLANDKSYTGAEYYVRLQEISPAGRTKTESTITYFGSRWTRFSVKLSCNMDCRFDTQRIFFGMKKPNCRTIMEINMAEYYFLHCIRIPVAPFWLQWSYWIIWVTAGRGPLSLRHHRDRYISRIVAPSSSVIHV